jgi:alkylhydroperoxidase family enzyme
MTKKLAEKFETFLKPVCTNTYAMTAAPKLADIAQEHYASDQPVGMTPDQTARLQIVLAWIAKSSFDRPAWVSDAELINSFVITGETSAPMREMPGDESAIVDRAVEAANEYVSSLPKGQNAWDKKEYGIAQTAAQTAVQALTTFKPAAHTKPVHLDRAEPTDEAIIEFLKSRGWYGFLSPDMVRAAISHFSASKDEELERLVKTVIIVAKEQVDAGKFQNYTLSDAINKLTAYKAWKAS